MRPAAIPRPPRPLSEPREASVPEPHAPLEAATESDDRRALPLRRYAKIKTELWQPGASLLEVLERHDLDAATWLVHEQAQQQALAREAREGPSDLARRLRKALAKARGELKSSTPDEP